MKVTVVIPVVIELDYYKIKVDKTKFIDDEYLDGLKSKIKDIAADIIHSRGIEPVIHSCEECPALMD